MWACCERVDCSANQPSHSQLTDHPTRPQACPVTKDDAWERHFRSQVDSWQQQAAAAAAAASAAVGAAATATTPTGAPAAAGGKQAAAAAAAACGAGGGKDRSKLAAAALERHAATTGAAAAGAAPASSAAPGLPSLAHGGKLRGSASGPGPGGGGAADAGAAAGSGGNMPRGGVRQLKGPGGAVTTVALNPEAAVVRIPAAAGDGASGRQAEAAAGQQRRRLAVEARNGAPGALAVGGAAA